MQSFKRGWQLRAIGKPRCKRTFWKVFSVSGRMPSPHNGLEMTQQRIQKPLHAPNQCTTASQEPRALLLFLRVNASLARPSELPPAALVLADCDPAVPPHDLTD